jgi:putative transposase
VLVDTLGLIVALVVLPANVTDWEGARELFRRSKNRLPRLEKVWADSAYKARKLTRWVAEHCSWVVEVVTRRDGVKGFAVLPKRWIVERTFGWFGRYRRLSKDYETNPRSSEAWIKIAMIHRMSRFELPSRNRDEFLLRRPKRRKVKVN